MDAQLTQLNDLIIESTEQVRSALGERVVLSTSLAPGLRPVEVDASQLRAAILDTAARAQDAMPHGGSFTIHTCNVAREEHHSDIRRAEYVQLSLRPVRAPSQTCRPPIVSSSRRRKQHDGQCPLAGRTDKTVGLT
jgi:hypothetical protein